MTTRPEPVVPGPGQESVWDYPRPPRLEPVARRLRVVLGGQVIADTTRGYRVLETSHPPNYYFPPADVIDGALTPAAGASFCEWKGRAHYYTVRGGDRVETEAAWGYEHPSPAFAALRGHVAFYAHRMDACFVDDEQVAPQPGRFYGGWITGDVVGPFKGGPGSRGW
ncbi:MAG: DUF427 domain-containing protein [Acidimicrobiia bacterium]